MTLDLNIVQNVKAPVYSEVAPSVPSWTVEYMTNNERHKKSFLDITKAYEFYKQIVDSLSKRMH